MISEPFERIVLVDAGYRSGRDEPVLHDHIGEFLREQTQAPYREAPQFEAASAFTDILGRALHGQLTRPIIDQTVWAGVREPADALAERLSALIDERPTWLYLRGAELMTLPSRLRARHPDVRITLRLPGPWPAPELFGRLPWRSQLLADAAGADIVSVPSERARKNLTRSFGRYLDDVGVAARKGTVMFADGRRLRTIANPPSIDVGAVLRRASEQAVAEEMQVWERQQLKGRRLVLAVERLHASSGLVEQLTAIERLLERESDVQDRVLFVVVATGAEHASASARSAIERTVGRINGRFTRPGGEVPVQYLLGEVTAVSLAALYRLAAVLVATPLSSGASMTAKEYIVVQHAHAGAGRVLLSETTGTAAELPSLATCNPFDLDAIAAGITEALQADPVDSERALSAAAHRIDYRDLASWWWREHHVAIDPKGELARR